MLKNILPITCIIVVFFVISADKTYALKKFAPKTASVKTASKSNISAQVKYRSDKRGVLLSIYNFSNLSTVDYILSYYTTGIQQGVGGRITSDNNPQGERELLFGTCSGGVCKYHQDIRDARLSLTATLKNGSIVKKSYRIKSYY